MSHLPATLRAMVSNYADGHLWDKLDADVCKKAAERIDQLTVQREVLWKNNNCWQTMVGKIVATIPTKDIVSIAGKAQGAADYFKRLHAQRDQLLAALKAVLASDGYFHHYDAIENIVAHELAEAAIAAVENNK